MHGKCYVGHSVQSLNERIGQHHRTHMEIIVDLNINLSDAVLIDDDEYSPDFHVINEHNLTSAESFNCSYEVFLLDICSPRNLELNEHRYIHKLKTLRPFGINTQNPFSIPLLNL